MDENQFYKTEIMTLFIKHNADCNMPLIEELSKIIGNKDRAASGVSEVVNNFVSTGIYNLQHFEKDISVDDLQRLGQNVYGIVWQNKLQSNAS